jgi:alpha-mannosidase
MHDDHVLVERRIRRELFERVMPAMYSAMMPMQVEAWDVPGEPVSYDEAVTATYRPFTIGSQWSRPWGTTWFRFSADVPDEWVGSQLEAVIDLGFHQDAAGFQSEGLVWTAAGPLQGVHPRRTGVPLPTAPAGSLTLLVEAASNPAFPGYRPSPLGSLSTAGDAPLYRLKQASLGVRNDVVFHLLLDVEVLFDLMRSLPLNEQRRQRLLRQLETAFDALDLSSSAAIAHTAAHARRLLQPALNQPARVSAHQVIAVGHAHIDSAWLWPIRETIRKCARTFASATRLMDDYPEYRFVCSQAAQYDWIERLYPSLFERIADRVAAGQWQPVGGMWVEADMNLPSGESIARQLIYGQRYFDSRFGVRCNEVWIPDVFGYPASLPQIFAAGGCERFITQKLSWNKQNVFPHSTFWWEGLNGTQVLTHFPPVDTYNARVVADEMVFADHNFKDHGWSDWSLMPYGHGNGGGGPTREMVERGRRMRDLDGAPRIHFGTTDEFFERVEHEAVEGAPVPVWRGELYFEMHRGTLTSQAATKVGNRRCEGLLREAELWLATIGAEAYAAAADELENLWKEVLLQQFHDIIPGSSIAWVYEDSEAAHRMVIARLTAIVDTALETLAAGALVVANAATHARTEVVAVPSAIASNLVGDGPRQSLADGTVAIRTSAPGNGVAMLCAEASADRVVVTEHSMVNGSLAISWDLDGELVSIIDVVRGRELLPTGRRVSVELAPDHPVEYDAWDLESWTRPKGIPVGGTQSVTMVDAGPLQASVQIRRSFGLNSSSMTQTYTLRAGSPRLDITFDIDWREDEQLLTLMVPLDVRATEALCDIQFGHVRRPTHASNSWDAAKFEVCAHRYVDLAEPSFGVAVLNDGRYGHGVQDGGISVSLLRAAKYPDPTADHGRHSVTIAVLPHGPGLHEVLAEAEAINMPLRVAGHAAAPQPDAAAHQRSPLVTVNHPGVQIAAVKRADDGSGDVIVRLFEACGDRAAITLSAAQPIRSAWRANLLEETSDAVDTADGIVAVTLRPFELVTLRLRT